MISLVLKITPQELAPICRREWDIKEKASASMAKALSTPSN